MNRNYHKIWVIKGLKRSGNHAIINWLQSQEDFFLINNFQRIKLVLIGEKELIPYEDHQAAIREKLNLERIKYLKKLHLKYVWESFKPHKNLILSFEDMPILHDPFPNLEYLEIVLLRDPVNLFASRIKKAFTDVYNRWVYPVENNEYMQRVVDNFRAYCHHIQSAKEGHFILYNLWFTNAEYREKIATKLGLDYNDKGFTTISHHGGGSSFEGRKHQGSSQKMNVLDRSSQLAVKEKELLEAVVTDDLIALYEETEAHHKRVMGI